MTQSGKHGGADGRVLNIQNKTCPVHLALHTSWALVTMHPFSFAVVPRDDDVVIQGNLLKMVATNVYDSLGARAREHAALTRVHSAAYRQQCHRVTVSGEAVHSTRVHSKRSRVRPARRWHADLNEHEPGRGDLGEI